MAGSFAQGYVPSWDNYRNYQWQNHQHGLDIPSGDTYMQDGESDQVYAFQPSPSHTNTKPMKPYEGPSFEDHQSHYANTTPQWVYGNATYNNKQRGFNSLNTGYQMPAFNHNYNSAPYSGDLDSLSSSPPGLEESGLRSKIRQSSSCHERKQSSGDDSSDSVSTKSVESFEVEGSRGLGSRAYQTSSQECSPRSKGAKHQQKQFTKNSNLLGSSNRINKKKNKSDTLYTSFKIQPRDYFKFGTVFLVLWSEPGGQLTESNKAGITEGRYGQLVHSAIRRMVVIGVQGLYCRCLPIGTYSERGNQKPSIDLATHAVIHEAGKPPLIDDEARKSMKEPIAVTLDNSAELYPNSRLDFGMVHSVHRNVRVKPLGELTEESKRLVGQYAREVFNRGIPEGY